jgi:Spy/CpxP family protein refolding chaperone
MMRRFALVSLALTALALTAPAHGQGKAKGTLPPYWGQIGLSDAQRQQIYRIRAAARADVDKLFQQIDERKARELDEMSAVLSDAQRQRLAEVITGKAGRAVRGKLPVPARP